jgi:hypothetical protein
MYVTTHQRGDGFGAIFQNIIFDILAAFINKHTYVYTPQKKMEHNYNNDANYITKLYEFINLKSIFPVPNEPVTLHEYQMSDVYPFVEKNLESLCNSDTMKLIKNEFYKNKINPYTAQYYNVAVHIRRPNPHDSRVDGANTPNDYYIKIMRHILKTHSGEHPIKFHIYSQGNMSMFKEFEEFNPIFHIDTPLEDTFLGLVFADILVLSRSSFSYVAGLLTNGTVYYNPFWHPSLNKWITLKDV